MTGHQTPETPQHIDRRPVWSGLQRALHWIMALSLIAILISIALVKHSPYLAESARDVHLMAGQLLTAALLIRLVMLFVGKQSLSISALVPSSTHWTAAKEMLLFYVTLGRSPLPNWYAHNPLWMPLYLLFFMLLTAQVGTGLAWLYSDNFTLWALHRDLSIWLEIWVVAHVVAVLLQDWKGTGSDVSAMINGHRIFVHEQEAQKPKDAVQKIDIKDLMKDR